jgi:HPt (histidine-containing phosphotransfer) domain-containing protein
MSEPVNPAARTPAARTPAARIQIEVDPDLAELIPGFLANREQDVATIRTALPQGDLTLIRRIGHGMKGEGAAFGFDGLSDLGAELEQAALAADTSEIARLSDAIADYLGRVELIGDGSASGEGGPA